MKRGGRVRTFIALSGSLTGAHTTPQGRARSNLYGFVGVSHEIGGLPLTLDAEFGWERGVFDEAPGGGKLDWQLGAEYRRGVVRAGLRYSGSDSAAGEDAIIASLFLDL